MGLCLYLGPFSALGRGETLVWGREFLPGLAKIGHFGAFWAANERSAQAPRAFATSAMVFVYFSAIFRKKVVFSLGRVRGCVDFAVKRSILVRFLVQFPVGGYYETSGWSFRV